MRYAIFDTQADEGKQYVGIDFVRVADIESAEHFYFKDYAQHLINQNGISSMIVVDTKELDDGI